MSIVALEMIGTITPAQANSMVLGQGVSVTPVSATMMDDPGVDSALHPELYDPLWGYFIFGQNVDFRYEGSRSYRDEATFTITGTFSINAELGVRSSLDLPPETTDTVRFNTLMEKFLDLEEVFTDAADSEVPVDPMTWGTEPDPRTIVLPDPLRDRNGDKVFAFPVSLDILPGRWPETIQYRAVLREAKLPAYKLKINDTILDGGILNIALPAPLLTRHRMVGCAGEMIQCRNYTVLACEARGTLPRVEGEEDLLGDAARELVDSFDLGFVTVKVIRRNQTTAPEQNKTVFPLMDVDKGTGLDMQVEALQTEVAVRMKARF